jgi:hypothetical protein
VWAVAVDFLKLHHSAMTTRSIDDDDIDEALWTAYRRCDKNAVTENLLCRYLPELTFIPNASAARDAVRESGRPRFLKDSLGVSGSILLAHSQ